MADLALWTIRKRKIRGKPFGFGGHLYLEQIYADNSEFISARKSAQSGLSEWCLNLSFHKAKEGYNIIYFFPTDGLMGDFVRGRVDPIINESKYFEELLSKTDNISMKSVGKGFIYFRGATSAKKAKSVDGDIVVYDELDELSEGTQERGEKRLGHSDLAWQRFISTATYPNTGISALYDDSCQYEWFIKCEHCGHSQTLDFFNNMDYTMQGNKCLTAKVICCKCKRGMDRLQQGFWVAKYPDNRKKGYAINKLMCERTNLISLVEASKNKEEYQIQEFFNSDLGLPYSPKGQKLSNADLDACKESGHLIRIGMPVVSEYNNLTMGVDVGKYLHIRVSTKEGDMKRLVWAGTVKSFDELGMIMNILNIKVCVIDANPETRKCKEFQKDFVGKVILAYYVGSDDSKSESFSLEEKVEDDGEEFERVMINRTQTCDAIISHITHFKDVFPENIDSVEDFYKQMTVPTRITKKHGRTGNLMAVYEDFGKADHFFHACVYDEIARNIYENGRTIIYENSMQGNKRLSVETGDEIGYNNYGKESENEFDEDDEEIYVKGHGQTLSSQQDF